MIFFAHRVQYQARHIVNLQAFHDLRTVGFHGFD